MWNFKDNSIEVINAFQSVAEEWLEDSSRILLNQTIQNNRVDTGKTKSSWKRQVEENKAVIGSTSENAIWEEFGTGHYAINGDGRKTAWYVPVEGYLGKNKPTYNGKVVIVHGRGGKDYYKTNGKKPNRPFEHARTTVEPKIQKRLKDLIKAHIT